MTSSEQLRGAIADRDTDDPAPANLPAIAAFGPPDQVRILQIIGLDPRDPRAHAVVAVAERYGLDPVLGHILILPKSNRPYITLGGYEHIAHRSGKLDGIEVVDGPRRDGAEWTAKVAVYRKDMSRAFTFPGRAELDRDNGPEMALARAERRALRRAFAITLPDAFAEDEYDTRPAAVLPPVRDGGPSPAPVPDAPVPARDEPIGDQQRKAIFAGFRELSIGENERRKLLGHWTGHTSVKDLTAQQAAGVLDRLTDIRADHERRAQDDDAERDDPPPADDDEPGPGGSPPATPDTRNRLLAVLRDAGITDKPDVLSLLSGWAGRGITRTGDLTEHEAQKALASATALTAVTGPDEENETGADDD